MAVALCVNITIFIHNPILYLKELIRLQKDNTADKAAQESRDRPVNLLKRIGPTDYILNIYFSKNSKETMEDKILRLIERKVRNSA